MPGQQRYSQQREAIYRSVLEGEDHPSAEMVYSRLKPSMPKLSLGTVYRNLHQMAEEGRMTEIMGPMIRFDAVTAPHAHFCCRECGGVFAVDLPYDHGLDHLAEMDGRIVQSHDLTFHGICPACLGGENRDTT